MTCIINNEGLLCRSTKANENVNVDFKFNHADVSELLATCERLNGKHECFNTKEVNITISDKNVTEAFIAVTETESFVKKAGQFVCQTGDLTIPCTWLPQASHDPNTLTSFTTEGFNKTADDISGDGNAVAIAVSSIVGVLLVLGIVLIIWKRVLIWKNGVQTSACIKKKDTATKGSCSDECSNRQEDLSSEDGDAGQDDSCCEALLTHGLSVNQTPHEAASEYVQITNDESLPTGDDYCIQFGKEISEYVQITNDESLPTGDDYCIQFGKEISEYVQITNDESLPTGDDYCIQFGKEISNEDSSSTSSFSIHMKNPSLYLAKDEISSGSVSRGKIRGGRKTCGTPEAIHGQNQVP